MKHVVIVSLIAIFNLSAAFSQEGNSARKVLVGTSITHHYKRGIERGLTAYALEGYVKDEKYGAFIGFETDDLFLDFTTAGEWWIFRQDLDYFTLKYGIDAIYHYQRFKYEGLTISHENDFMADICFSLRTAKDFEFLLRTGYGAKLSFLPALSEPISDFTPCVYIGFGKSFTSRIDFLFSASTHLAYRYPLFCSPDYALTLAYNAKSGIRSALTLDMRINDQFTTAPYINRVALTASLSFFLKKE